MDMTTWFGGGFSGAWLLFATVLLLLAALALQANGATVEADPENIQAVLDAVNPGDTVVLSDGTYTGGLRLSRSGTSEAPIVIRAAGKGAVVDGGRDGLSLDGVSWVTVEGIRFQNAEVAGIYVRQARPSGPPYASHVTIRNCVFADNRKWGCITSHIDHFVIEGCETFGATIEHGIYVANASVGPIVRNNIVHHNVGNGIHINGDPDCGGTGLIEGALVEGNVIFENGTRGGSALSIMHVTDSLFRNNLIYHNYAHGITLFAYTGDIETQSCRRNRVYHNTVFFRPGEGRFSLLMRRKSRDCDVRNNVFVGGARGAMYVEPSCLDGLTIDRNVVFNFPGQRLFGDSLEGKNFDSTEGSAARLETWKKLGFEPDTADGVEIDIRRWVEKGFDTNSSFDVMPEFADTEKGDFHLAGGSAGIDFGDNLAEAVPVDIEGTTRPQGTAPDCGCYEMTREEE